MAFFMLMLGISFLAYLPQFFVGDRRDYRMALRHGMAGGFIFTGIDHFVNAQTRLGIVCLRRYRDKKKDGERFGEEAKPPS